MTVQGPVKEQQPDGMSHRGGYGSMCSSTSTVGYRGAHKAVGLDSIDSLPHLQPSLPPSLPLPDLRPFAPSPLPPSVANAVWHRGLTRRGGNEGATCGRGRGRKDPRGHRRGARAQGAVVRARLREVGS